MTSLESSKSIKVLEHGILKLLTWIVCALMYEVSTLFKGVYYFLAIPVAEHTIQGSTLIKGAYYLRNYGSYIF